MDLNEWLKEKGWTKTEFARRLNVCRESIYNWAILKRKPTKYLLAKIIELTEGNVQEADFLTKRYKSKICETCGRKWLSKDHEED